MNNIEQAKNDIASAEGLLRAAKANLEKVQQEEHVIVQLFTGATCGHYSVLSHHSEYDEVSVTLGSEEDKYVGSGVITEAFRKGWAVYEINARNPLSGTIQIRFQRRNNID